MIHYFKVFTSKIFYTSLKVFFIKLKNLTTKDCYVTFRTKSIDNMTFINLVGVKRNYLALLNLLFE